MCDMGSTKALLHMVFEGRALWLFFEVRGEFATFFFSSHFCWKISLRHTVLSNLGIWQMFPEMIEVSLLVTIGSICHQ